MLRGDGRTGIVAAQVGVELPVGEPVPVEVRPAQGRRGLAGSRRSHDERERAAARVEDRVQRAQLGAAVDESGAAPGSCRGTRRVAAWWKCTPPLMSRACTTSSARPDTVCPRSSPGTPVNPRPFLPGRRKRSDLPVEVGVQLLAALVEVAGQGRGLIDEVGRSEPDGAGQLAPVVVDVPVEKRGAERHELGQRKDGFQLGDPGGVDDADELTAFRPHPQIVFSPGTPAPPPFHGQIQRRLKPRLRAG
ncbi:hypothetical protein K1Y72_26580 [Actinomadura sp. PM05-2]|uniref:Uncharacterized protein n=1 Tax=Actinomadura parmotrematis TaxID=2864039 RepID=A0ABS7FZU7_9ACTN|nr:hypothetical protein [Actinomadura parmotrematis]MBW8485969.1 hypothetical protein [Actinomadura parmotrematis]